MPEPKQTGIVNIRGKEYRTVARRVADFREEHPIDSGWSLLTQIVSIDERAIVIKAQIANPEGRIVAEGFAEEVRASSQINRTSALENCETSAIGRALAAAGLGGTEYASANEVQNAIYQQAAPPATGSTSSEKARLVLTSEVGCKSKEDAEASIRFATDRSLGAADLDRAGDAIYLALMTRWEASGCDWSGYLRAAKQAWDEGGE